MKRRNKCGDRIQTFLICLAVNGKKKITLVSEEEHGDDIFF